MDEIIIGNVDTKLIDQFSIILVETVPIPTYVGVLGVLGFGSDPWAILSDLGWEPISQPQPNLCLFACDGLIVVLSKIHGQN